MSEPRLQADWLLQRCAGQALACTKTVADEGMTMASCVRRLCSAWRTAGMSPLVSSPARPCCCVSMSKTVFS